MDNSRGTYADTGEGGLAGELAYILGCVIVARSSPESVGFVCSFVENGVCSGAIGGLSVIRKGLGTMGVNSKGLVRSGFTEVVWVCAASVRILTPPEVLPTSEPL